MIEWSWEPSGTVSDPFSDNPFATPSEPGWHTYSVEINNDICFREDQVEVFVINAICQEPFIFLPNTFTPNGDGENDILFLRSNFVAEMRLSIYNRLGQLVFESIDQDQGWDGTFKGKELPPDVFGFFLDVTCLDGQTFQKKGSINLLR